MDSMVDAKTPAIIPSTEDKLTVGAPHCPAGKQDAKPKSPNSWHRQIQAECIEKGFIYGPKRGEKSLKKYLDFIFSDHQVKIIGMSKNKAPKV